LSLPFTLNEEGKEELRKALQLTLSIHKGEKLMALTDYSELEKEIADAPEPKTLPRGSEVKARIIAVRSGISDKNGCTWYQPVFDIPDDPMVVEFNAFFWDLAEAKEKLEPKQVMRNTNSFKNFAAAFELDYSRPFDWEEDLNGLEGWVILGFKKDDEFGDKNTVAKYVAGKHGPAHSTGAVRSDYIKQSAGRDDGIPF
jgi:hypothetical protein